MVANATADDSGVNSGTSADQVKVQDSPQQDNAADTSAVQKDSDLTLPANSKLISSAENPAQLIDKLASVLPVVTFTNDAQAEQVALHHDPGSGEGEGDQPPTPANVKKDDQGHVVEVDYPNGTMRKFGYDDSGNLNRIEQPNGQVLVLKDGKWQPESGGNARGPGAGGSGGKIGEPIDRPRAGAGNDIAVAFVASDGTFTYQTTDGAFVNVYADGKQSRVADVSIVESDIDNHVTSIHYPDGTFREFKYGDDGKVASVTENGVTYNVNADGELVGPDGKVTGVKNVSVRPDGTYRFEDENGTTSLHANLSSEVQKRDGSTVTTDKHGHVTEVQYADGKTVAFGYDDNGQINQITDQDGKSVPFASATVDADGTVHKTLDNGRVEHDFTNGAIQKTDGTIKQLTEDADIIHTLTNKTDLDPNDIESLNKLLDRLSTADREQVMAVYQEKYGVSMKDDLNKLGATGDHAKMLLADADLRTEGLKTLPDQESRDMWDRSIDSFERRAKAQGMSEADIARHEKEYLAYLEKHANDGKSGPDLVRDVQKEMAKDAAPEHIKLSTDHFDIDIVNMGDVTPEQVEQMKKDLEDIYKKYQDYYGVDLNSVIGRKFQAGVITADELGWAGGGTIDTNSVITPDVLAGLVSKDPSTREGALGILAHELGNGWASLYAGHDGTLYNTPGWYGAEGQAGFYKSHYLIDSGYTQAAKDEYDRALQDFAQYQEDVKAGKKPSDGENSAASHVIVESLYQKFGYGPMQDIDKMIQSGELKFDPNASPEENNGRLIYALSQSTHTNLLDFMDKYNIPVTQEWRQKIEALGYADSGMQLATSTVPGSHEGDERPGGGEKPEPGPRDGDQQTGPPPPHNPPVDENGQPHDEKQQSDFAPH